MGHGGSRKEKRDNKGDGRLLSLKNVRLSWHSYLIFSSATLTFQFLPISFSADGTMSKQVLLIFH